LTYMSTFGIDRKEKAKGIARFIRKNKMHFETREIDDVIVYDVKWKFKITDERPVALHDDVKSQLKSGKIHFLFNLKDVEYMDSFGLGGDNCKFPVYFQPWRQAQAHEFSPEDPPHVRNHRTDQGPQNRQ
jgi:hypothetical protein